MRTRYSAGIRNPERNGPPPGHLILRSGSKSEKDHEDDLGNSLPVRTRLGVAGGGQRMHQGRYRRRRRRPRQGGVAGHGRLGAVAGCVVGRHEANKQNPNNSNAQAPSGEK
jgi:hypothetical protein